jgi:hypothetical protein
LTAAQKRALELVHAPLTSPQGEIYPGQPGAPKGSVRSPSAQIFKFLIFNDPEWDYSTYNLANLKKDTALAATFLDAMNPDLSGFRANGGKLLIRHEWADSATGRSAPCGTATTLDPVD